MGITDWRQILFLMFSLAEGDWELEELSDLICYHSKSVEGQVLMDSPCMPYTLD